MSNSLVPRIGKLLRKHKLKLVTAESCTGGLVGHLVTNTPGSSDYYLGGVVSYANEVKVGLVGVKLETLQKYGAVSKQTALEMATGVRTALKGDVGISVTGIAGPGGGTAEKPVGLTWVGISTKTKNKAHRFVWDKDRLGNKKASAQAALEILWEYLKNLEGG